jgi:antitoxin component YwqK of YwqJK toxin-antitoxin module
MPPQLPVELMRRPSFTWMIGAVLLAVIAGASLFWKPSLALPEVLASELARREGLLYLGKDRRPFTGFMLEKYANGTLKSRSTVRDGILDGLSEGWHANGQLQVREVFQKGVSHGLREKWYENGVKLSEGAIAEGKHDGLFRRWHENRVLAEEVTMRGGVPDGISRAFYSSGFLKTQVTLKDGKVVEQKTWADSEMKSN